jgi:type IV pilus assembly protein PilA
LKTFSPRRNGFTLIEIVIVLVVLGILAVMAMPDLSVAAVRGQIKESASLIDVAKKGVQTAYTLTGVMPATNVEAGLPEPAKLVGKYVTGIDVKDGAVNVTWGNSVNSNLAGKVLTLRPAYVDGQPTVPVSWICSAAPVPVGMKLAGADKTDFPKKYTPFECQPKAAT